MTSPQSPKGKQGSDASIVTYEKEVGVEEAVEMVGFGRAHIIGYVIIGLFTAADSIEVAFLSYLTEVLKEPWGLTAFDQSMLEAMVFLGQIVGAPAWGYFADKHGRRPVFLVSAALITACGCLTALTTGKLSLIFVRFFVGVGVAGLSVPFDIFAEMLPDHMRGKLLLSTFFWFAFGSLYTTAAAASVLCQFGWRWFTLLCAMPTLVATVAGLYFLPESTHWLASTGQQEEAAEVMNGIAKQNGAGMRFKKLSVPPVLEKLRTRDLLRKKGLRRPFYAMAIVWMGFGVGFYGISLMLPHIFSHSAGEGRRLAAAACGAHGGVGFDFVKIAKGNAGMIAGLIYAISLVDSWGRKPTQMTSYGFSGILAFGLAFPEYLSEGAITAMVTVALAFQMSGSCSTWTHTPEVFPTNVRGAANALCNASARFGAMMSTFLIGDLVPFKPTMMAMAGFCFMSTLAITFVPETAGTHLDGEVSDSDTEGECRAAPGGM